MVTTLTIAGTALTLAAAPVDLNARLIATTGCSAPEIEQLLASGPDRVARALEPFLAQPVDHIDLANLIAVDTAAIGLVRALYAALPADEPAPVAMTADTPEAE